MFDPISLWMQSSVFWIRVFKQQQDAYWRAVGAVAATVPHETSADLAREAEAMKSVLAPAEKSARPVRRKPSARTTSAREAPSLKSVMASA